LNRGAAQPPQYEEFDLSADNSAAGESLKRQIGLPLIRPFT
jgi:hypothetical protein